MEYWKTAAQKFTTRLGFKQYDVILSKKQSVLIKIKSSFEVENTQMQFSVLGYRLDSYILDYKLALEIDENGHSQKNIDYEVKEPKTNK